MIGQVEISEPMCYHARLQAEQQQARMSLIRDTTPNIVAGGTEMEVSLDLPRYRVCMHSHVGTHDFLLVALLRSKCGGQYCYQ